MSMRKAAVPAILSLTTFFLASGCDSPTNPNEERLQYLYQ